VDVVDAETAFDAQVAAVYRAARVGGDADDLAVFHVQVEVAAGAAEGAGGADFRNFPLPSLAEHGFFGQCAGRAHRHAGAAGHADRIGERLVHCGGHLGPEAAIREVYDRAALFFLAGPQAFAAQDAFVHVAHDEDVIVFQIVVLGVAAESARFDIVEIGVVLKFAVACLVAGKAVLGVIVEHEFKDGLPGFDDLRRGGFHNHSLLCCGYA